MGDTKIYAYDFFDTIVHRDCHPEIVLYQWAKYVAEYVDFEISPSKLYKLRKNVEEKLKKNVNIEEPTDKELIAEIFNSINLRGENKEEFLQFCFQCELEVELKHLYCDDKCVQEIRNHKKANHLVIIISDFYLGKEFILAILSYFGIEKLFDEVFVSSDVNRRKSTGSLYRYILSFYMCSPKELFMSGDNFSSDISVPRELGINTYYREYKQCYKNLTLKELKKSIKKLLFNDSKKKPLCGYSGELLFFISKLYKELTRNGVKKVLFCSREGQVLKALFDTYQLKMRGRISIVSEYFYVSRKATLLPSLSAFEKEKFSMLFRDTNTLRIKDFLNNLSFSSEEIENVCKSIKCSMEDIVSIDENNNIYRKLKQNKAFLEKYDEKRESQKLLFFEYLKSLGITLSGGQITIVDIGWKGTIQDCIQASVSEDCSVEGYYLGLRTENKKSVNQEKKHGILFSDYPSKSKNYNIFEHGFMFYERIFVADHGPVLGYFSNGMIVEPLINNNADELLLFNYMKPYIDNILEIYEELLELFVNVQWEPYELDEFMTKIVLWRQCVYTPQFWNIEVESRHRIRENFGSISKNANGNLRKRQIEKKVNSSYFFVEYSFRILERYHLKFLYPLAYLYCELVYLIKKIIWKKKK